jgi:hypothetical protein
MKTRRTTLVGSVALVAATLSLVETARALTPVTLPPAKVLTVSLTQAITSGQLRVAFSSLGSGEFSSVGGIQIGKRWHAIGRHDSTVARASKRPTRHVTTIKLTAEGRRLLKGRTTGKVRVTIKGAGRQIQTVVTLPR